MASSKVMASPNPTSSDLSTTTTSSRSPTSTKPQTNNHINTPSVATVDNMTVDGILSTVYASPSAESTLLDAQITLIDTPTPLPFEQANINGFSAAAGDTHLEINDVLPTTPLSSGSGKTVEEVWRGIVAGKMEIVVGRREMKEEEPEEIMTLEDFLAKAGAVGDGQGEEDDVGDVKIIQSERQSGGVHSFDPTPSSGTFHMLDKVAGSIVAFGSSGGSGSGRGKRGRASAVAMEPLDKAAQQRQRRMIKNRESAARSRERKQAYQVELESLAVRLEEENEQLLKEKEKRSKERLKQLMEKIIPVDEKRRPKRILRRVNSLQW